MDEIITISPRCFHSCLKAQGSSLLFHSILHRILYIDFIPQCIRKLLWLTPSPLSPVLRQPVSLSELAAPRPTVPDAPCPLPGPHCCLGRVGCPQEPTWPFSLIGFPGCVTHSRPRRTGASGYILCSFVTRMDNSEVPSTSPLRGSLKGSHRSCLSQWPTNNMPYFTSSSFPVFLFLVPHSWLG